MAGNPNGFLNTSIKQIEHSFDRVTDINTMLSPFKDSVYNEPIEKLSCQLSVQLPEHSSTVTPIEYVDSVCRFQLPSVCLPYIDPFLNILKEVWKDMGLTTWTDLCKHDLNSCYSILGHISSKIFSDRPVDYVLGTI